MIKPPLPDPTPDLYHILDDAGLLTGSLLATRAPMAKIVEAIRNEIVCQTAAYIIEREASLTSKETKHGKKI